jgi:anti-sigma factor RsiW
MNRGVAQDVKCMDSRLLEAYLDGELDASGLVDVEAHLSGCDVCRERLALGQATKQSLKRALATPSFPSSSGGRDALRARALTAMMAEQDRQVAAVGEATARQAARAALGDGRFHWRTVVPIASAAALALFWGAASRGPIAQVTGWGKTDTRWNDTPGMQAGLAGDDLLADLLHEHSHPVPPQWTDPRDVRALDQYVGVPVRPGRFERGGASLVGARVLPIHHERAAMLQYVIGHGDSQRRLSVFVFDPSKIQISGPGLSPGAVGTAQVRVGQENGYSVAVTQQGGAWRATSGLIRAPKWLRWPTTASSRPVDGIAATPKGGSQEGAGGPGRT